MHPARQRPHPAVRAAEAEDEDRAASQLQPSQAAASIHNRPAQGPSNLSGMASIERRCLPHPPWGGDQPCGNAARAAGQGLLARATAAATTARETGSPCRVRRSRGTAQMRGRSLPPSALPGSHPSSQGAGERAPFPTLLPFLPPFFTSLPIPVFPSFGFPFIPAMPHRSFRTCPPADAPEDAGRSGGTRPEAVSEVHGSSMQDAMPEACGQPRSSGQDA